MIYKRDGNLFKGFLAGQAGDKKKMRDKKNMGTNTEKSTQKSMEEKESVEDGAAYVSPPNWMSPQVVQEMESRQETPSLEVGLGGPRLEVGVGDGDSGARDADEDQVKEDDLVCSRTVAMAQLLAADRQFSKKISCWIRNGTIPSRYTQQTGRPDPNYDFLGQLIKIQTDGIQINASARQAFLYASTASSSSSSTFLPAHDPHHHVNALGRWLKEQEKKQQKEQDKSTDVDSVD